MSTLLKDRNIKIKKARRCSWCDEMLHVGEKAQYTVMIYEVDFNADTFHLECYEALCDLPNDEPYDTGSMSRGCLCLKGECRCKPLKEAGKMSAGKKTCKWEQDDEGIWHTDCGNAHVIEADGPEENGMKYCCYCGKILKEAEKPKVEEVG